MKEKEGSLTAIGFRWPGLFVEWMQWTAYQSNRANQMWDASGQNRADSVGCTGDCCKWTNDEAILMGGPSSRA